MKILLTGAAGYIGSFLTEYLSKETSHRIIPLVRKLPGYFKDWRDEFEVVEGDITQLDKLKEKVPKKIDCLIHLAAFNNVHCSQKPEKALIVNGMGTRNMLEIAKERGCKTFIYFSTLQVYGKELEGTITVDSPIKCADDYALTHYVAEGYGQMFSLGDSFNVSVVRPANIFGCPVHPKIDRWTLVPACFCLSAYEKNEIRLKSSGKQNRDFVSLGFISQCVKYLIEKNESGFNIFNLTSEKLFTIIEVAELVRSSARSILDRDIRLIRKSKFPLKSNQFLAKNNLLIPPTRDEVKDDLIDEINKTLGILKEGDK